MYKCLHIRSHANPSHLRDDTHLASTAVAGHSVPLTQVVEACLGQLSGCYDGDGPGEEGVQAVLLSAHAGVVARRSLVGHVLDTAGAQWTGGWRGREAQVKVADRLFALARWRVQSSWAGTGKLEGKENIKTIIII